MIILILDIQAHIAMGLELIYQMIVVILGIQFMVLREQIHQQHHINQVFGIPHVTHGKLIALTLPL